MLMLTLALLGQMMEFSAYPSGSDEALIIVWIEFNSHFPVRKTHMAEHTAALVFLRHSEREQK